MTEPATSAVLTRQEKKFSDKKSLCGQNTTHTRCTASTHLTGTVSSWNLDNLHTGTANKSFPRRVWLDYGVRALGAIEDYTYRGFKSMQ